MYRKEESGTIQWNTVYDVYCEKAHEIFYKSMVKSQREIDI